MCQNTEDRGKIIIYQTESGTIDLDVRLDKDTVWLTQSQMGVLFDRNRTVISRHINNIFEEGELQEAMVCAKFAHTTQHGAIVGKTQKVEVTEYNLGAVIYQLGSLNKTAKVGMRY
jgi:hypothetical protein